MAKIVKSIRVDEALLDIVDRYKKEMKRIFKADVSSGALLSSALVLGIKDRLEVMKLLIDGDIIINDGKPVHGSNVVTEETKKLWEDYEALYFHYSDMVEE